MDAVQNVARSAKTPTAQPGGRHLATLLTALVVFTVGLLGLAAGTASAATTSDASSTTGFTSAVAGTVTATGPTTFTLSGSGVATGLGQVTYAGTVTITSAPGVVPLTDTLVETLTAKNGDSITLRCEQSAVPVGDTGVLKGTDRWTVIGGTGKYGTAKGSGTGTTLIYNLSRFAKTATGTVTLR